VRLFNLKTRIPVAAATVLASAAMFAAPAAQAAWEPTKPVEFIVPAGTGGGADQMARLIQGAVVKHNLMKQPLVVVNMSGGAGAEGFLDMKGSKGDPHKIVITLSNLFTTPMATGVPFNWRDLTPVAMLALDNFVLWVNAETPYKSAQEYLTAAKAAGAGASKFKMGGTGSKQEDQILTVGLEKASGAKFIYVPFKGGGTVAVQLVGKHIDSSVNNPAEAVAQWRAGKLRPLCVFDDERMPYKAKITDTQSWSDVPTCKEAGIPTSYTMLRGIFTSPGVTNDQKQFYVDLMKKVRETPEWKDYMEKGAFNQTFMEGEKFNQWLGGAENTHRELMKEAGFLAK
jgi:tripartite-type tricarboxylate transporter receptor subunit TctC